MSFLYPRTVTIKRSTPQTGVGALPYGGVTQDDETVQIYKVRASIQFKQMRSQQPAGLPADPSGNLTGWTIIVPRVRRGQIMDNDIVVDDLGERYQVVANYWNSLGYQLTCNKLAS